jgi:hypothetical protein
MQVNTLDRNDVAALFNGYYQSARVAPHGWTGSADGCVPGDTSATFKQAQIGQINWNRAMAGVPAQVQFDDTHLAGEQQLGVMLAVNRMLSHTPPISWLCYTAAAAEAAGKSNITLSLKSGPDDGALPSPGFVSGFMQDAGAANVDVGHRRWLLHPPTTQMTIGMGQARGTDGFLATGGGIRVIYPNGFDPWPQTRWGYVAWPAPGFVPWQEAPSRWSIIIEKADFSAATVRVIYGTAIVPTRIISASGPSGPFFGGPALVWEFTGASGATFDPLAPAANFAFLKPDRDTAYVVHVDNVNVQGQGMRSFEYRVVVFDPATHEVDFNVLFEKRLVVERRAERARLLRREAGQPVIHRGLSVRRRWTSALACRAVHAGQRHKLQRAVERILRRANPGRCLQATDGHARRADPTDIHQPDHRHPRMAGWDAGAGAPSVRCQSVRRNDDGMVVVRRRVRHWLGL